LEIVSGRKRLTFARSACYRRNSFLRKQFERKHCAGNRGGRMTTSSADGRFLGSGVRAARAIVIGGSGLYIKALTHGLAPLPESDPRVREKLNAMSLDNLRAQLVKLDPEAAKKIDIKNRRRLVRVLEICLITGKPASEVVAGVGDSGRPGSIIRTKGVFVFRDREELYQRINQRVEAMFARGVIEEVRAAAVTSATASQMIGLREIRELLAGKKSLPQCIAEIQQATRRYAKRQLTWFRRQSNFLPLNLSFLTHNEAVKWISLRILSEARARDD